MKNSVVYIGFLGLFLLVTSMTMQQDDLETIRRAIQIANVDILSRNCDNQVEIITDKLSGIYSRNQAKYILKEFFIENPVSGFSYLHHGSSPAGARYAVGELKSSKASFRVSIKFRKEGDKLYIDSMQFSKE